MNNHKYIKAFALALIIPVLVYASSPPEREQPGRLALLRTKVATNRQVNQLEQAFLDAVDVLEHDSPCVRFYSDRQKAVNVLCSLVDQIHVEPMPDIRVGVKMSGPFTFHVDAQTGAAYRLFQHADINLDGSFYRTKSFTQDRAVPHVGSFPPNTREARVLILLHELAHLMVSRDGKWLIPDDGNNADLSRKNSLTVETRCGDQIKAINAGLQSVEPNRILLP